MSSPHERRLEGLQKVYLAARREYEESFFSSDPARLVAAWDAEQRAFSALLSFMAAPAPFDQELETTRKILDDAETDKTRPLPDLSDLESLNSCDEPGRDATVPLDPSALEMTEADPVGPILRAMARSHQEIRERKNPKETT